MKQKRGSSTMLTNAACLSGVSSTPTSGFSDCLPACGSACVAPYRGTFLGFSRFFKERRRYFFRSDEKNSRLFFFTFTRLKGDTYTHVSSACNGVGHTKIFRQRLSETLAGPYRTVRIPCPNYLVPRFLSDDDEICASLGETKPGTDGLV